MRTSARHRLVNYSTRARRRRDRQHIMYTEGTAAMPYYAGNSTTDARRGNHQLGVKAAHVALAQKTQQVEAQDERLPW